VKIEVVGLYQKCLLGGLGGLLGWALITLFTPAGAESTLLVLLRALLTGALIGLAIGGCCGTWEGLFRDGSRQRLIHGAKIGAAVGLAGGAIALVAGELLFAVIGGGFFWRALGWGVFGAGIGTYEGIAKKMPQKLLFGVFGGFLGGLIGGSTYETLANLFGWMGFDRDVAIAVGGSVGLVLLGMCIGLMMGLVEEILRPAWFTFASGKLEGQTRTLDPKKTVTTIGRTELADICLLGDPSVADEHAQLVYRDNEFIIESVSGELLINRNGRFEPMQSIRLQTGDMIQIGSVRARFTLGDVTT